MELYRKHRPQTLDALAGNAPVRAALEGLLASPDGLPHTVLLAGPSGCGKTTVARILAARLGIADADFNETNTANFRGIESARQIVERMAYAPSAGKARMWLLDECHQITADAWNALLKPLEDTPRHVYFVLCTTNPEKIPKTILTRCSRFDLEPLTPEEIGRQVLVPVCKAEGLKPPMPVLQQIARDCMGSARAALVVLEKVARLPPEQMAAVAEQTAARESKLNELCQALLKSRPWKDVAVILKGLTEDPESCRRGVLGYMSAVLLNSGSGRAYNIMCAFERPYYDSGRAGLLMSCFDALAQK